jgi:hypothetical protein
VVVKEFVPPPMVGEPEPVGTWYCSRDMLVVWWNATVGAKANEQVATGWYAVDG